MFATRHMHLEMELVRWLLLVIAAFALVLALATAVAADPMGTPQLLPADMGELAKPIPPTDPVRPFFPEAPAMEVPAAEMAARLWTVLEEHRAGHVATALAAWEQIRLPYATAHYRELAMGAAYLQAGDQEQAERHLLIANQMQPVHPVVAYFTGLLRLEQAANVTRAPDLAYGRTRLVAFTPQEDKAMYEGMALAELRDAIAYANDLWIDERLVTTNLRTEEMVIMPHVGDLLAALGAENYVGKAHHTLFGLLMDRGELVVAETHLDAAADTGIATLYGYEDLATTYLAEDRPADALRVLRKDLALNHAWVGRAWHQLDDATHAAAKGTWVW